MSRGVVVRFLIDHGRRIRLGGESKQIVVRLGCWYVVAWSGVVVAVVVGVSVVVVECWAVCRSCFDLTSPQFWLLIRVGAAISPATLAAKHVNPQWRVRNYHLEQAGKLLRYQHAIKGVTIYSLTVYLHNFSYHA